MIENRVMLADSYKYSHAEQYPDNMVSMYDYMESRGGVYPATKFFGLQYYLKKYFTTPITIEEIKEARDFAKEHGVPFDYKGWKRIIKKHKGLLPVRIKAVPEGSLIPTGNVLMTIESTDAKIPWVAGWLETVLMKIWYPTTIATKSHYMRETLGKYGSEEWANFAYHNFGDRGSSSVESAAIGGMAHLSAGFMGTDNFNCLRYAKHYYNSPIAAYSVFATEHSTTTSYGSDGEEQFVYDKLVANPDAPIMSFVADSYDVYNFTNFCTAPDSRIRKLIESRPHQKLVLRPDSGNPKSVVSQMLTIMNNNNISRMTFPDERILFTDFAILWGDGITPETIEEILEYFTEKNRPYPTYAAENFVFGSGGDLMQNVTRDTQKFAIKCSSITTKHTQLIEFGGEDTYTKDVDVFKDPITDPGKKSKKGKVTTYYNPTTEVYFVDKIGLDIDNGAYEVLREVFLNGKLLIDDSLETIRSR
jgi:nicotinamide phosphoribosyltransferase